MEIIIQIVKQLPPVLPRVIVLLVLALLFFIPELRSKILHAGSGKRRLECLKQLLELRKLELSVKELKAKNPDAEESNLDTQIDLMLRHPDPDDQATEPICWSQRFVFALIGSVSLSVLSLVALWRIESFGNAALPQVVVVDMGVALLSGLLASAIPSRSWWECTLRGVLIPALLAALVVAGMGHLPSTR